MRAATAWGREAALAERLEQNRAASRSGAKTVVRHIDLSDDQSELRHFSEIPIADTRPSEALFAVLPMTNLQASLLDGVDTIDMRAEADRKSTRLNSSH